MTYFDPIIIYKNPRQLSKSLVQEFRKCIQEASFRIEEIFVDTSRKKWIISRYSDGVFESHILKSVWNQRNIENTKYLSTHFTNHVGIIYAKLN